MSDTPLNAVASLAEAERTRNYHEHIEQERAQRIALHKQAIAAHKFALAAATETLDVGQGHLMRPPERRDRFPHQPRKAPAPHPQPRSPRR